MSTVISADVGNVTASAPRTLTGTMETESLSSALYSAAKRVIDVFLCLIALIVLAPVFLVTAVAIKLYDGGPVFFSQTRVGRANVPFQCYKFRSMIVNAESLHIALQEQNEHEDLRTFKMKDDPRITPAGKIIRRFSIDELPQIMNVLLGQMSIVGPRPSLPCEVDRYTPDDMQRLAVKPGLTCIWQVSGRSQIPFPEQLKMDLQYIQTQSLATDMRLILRTIPAVLVGDGAE